MSNLATTEEVNALVMRDAEQPGFERATVFERVQLPVSLEQRLLYDVLTVEDRPNHARTIPMQAGAEVLDRFEEGKVSGLEEANGGRVG